MLSWAFAPVVITPQSDTTGLTLSIGGGGGRYEAVVRSCAGELLDARPAEFSSYGAKAEYQTDQLWRFSGFTGITSVSTEPSNVPGDRPYADGLYGGLLVAAEWDRVGLGAGLASFPGPDASGLISYLRLGPRAGHLRLEIGPPSTTPTVTGLFRGGFGFRRDRVRGVIGLEQGRVFENGVDNGGPFFDLELPLRTNLDLTLAGSWHLSEQYPDWGAGIGARYRILPR